MGTRKVAQQRVVDVVEYIFSYSLEHGVAPSLREIAEAFSVSLGTISTALKRGLDRGLLERRGDAKYRAIYAKETPEGIERKIRHLERERYRLRMSVGTIAVPGVSL